MSAILMEVVKSMRQTVSCCDYAILKHSLNGYSYKDRVHKNCVKEC